MQIQVRFLLRLGTGRGLVGGMMIVLAVMLRLILAGGSCCVLVFVLIYMQYVENVYMYGVDSVYISETTS